MAENGTETILPKRSQSISLALSEAPYRTFLTNTPQEGRSPANNLLLYCLPTSVAEYVATEEAATVRSSILTATTNTVVAVYSVEQDGFLGGDEAALLAAISGQSSGDAFSKAALLALADLDKVAAEHLIVDAKDTVIVVGSGGREHALAVAVARSPLVGKVICCPGNGGTADLREREYASSTSSRAA